MSSRQGERRSARSAFANRALHLFALSSVAIAQPVLDLLGRHPDDLVAQDLDASDIWLLVAAVFLGVPAVLVAAAECWRWTHRFLRRVRSPAREDPPAAGASGAPISAQRPPGEALYTVFMALLFGLLFSSWLSRLAPLSGPVHLLLALALGSAATLAARRVRALAQGLSWLAVAAPAVPILFLFFTPVRELVLPTTAEAPEASPLPTTPRQLAALPAGDIPVVMVVFDELPVVSLMNGEGEIDPELYPHFAALAATSTWFRNATSPSPVTWRAVPSLLSGRYPRDGELPTAAHHPGNLFTWLHANGYEVRAVEPKTQLCPTELLLRQRLPPAERFAGTLKGVAILLLHLALPPSLDRELPDINAGWVHRSLDRVEEMRSFLANIRPRPRHQFLFLHSMLPHHPWRFLPSGKAYHVGTGELVAEGVVYNFAGRWSADAWAMAQAYQRHLLQVQLADRLLGELVDRLRQLDLFEPALLVVAADHGISFRPGGLLRKIDGQNFADVLSVPLFIKLPGQAEGAIDDRDVELVDVVPTIAEALGLEPDWSVDGRSTLSRDERKEWRKLVYLTPEQKLWIDDPSVFNKEASLARKLSVFAAQAGPQALYALGPYHRELLGRPLDTLAVVEGSELRAAVDSFDRYSRVDTTASTIPSRVTGQLESEAPLTRPTPLALAVNGVVRALTLTRRSDGGRSFSFMVPEEAFLSGHNELSILIVAEHQDGLQLERLKLPVPVDYILVFDDRGHPEAVLAAGEEHPVDMSRPAGQAADIVYEDREYQVVLLGWSRDEATQQGPERILVFDDERLVHVGGLNFDQDAIRDRYRMPEKEEWAFHYVVPRDDIRGTIRLFALFGSGEARPLTYTQRLQPQKLPIVRS